MNFLIPIALFSISLSWADETTPVVNMLLSVETTKNPLPELLVGKGVENSTKADFPISVERTDPVAEPIGTLLATDNIIQIMTPTNLGTENIVRIEENTTPTAERIATIKIENPAVQAIILAIGSVAPAEETIMPVTESMMDAKEIPDSEMTASDQEPTDLHAGLVNSNFESLVLANEEEISETETPKWDSVDIHEKPKSEIELMELYEAKPIDLLGEKTFEEEKSVFTEEPTILPQKPAYFLKEQEKAEKLIMSLITEKVPVATYTLPYVEAKISTAELTAPAVETTSLAQESAMTVVQPTSLTVDTMMLNADTTLSTAEKLSAAAETGHPIAESTLPTEKTIVTAAEVSIPTVGTSSPIEAMAVITETILPVLKTTLHVELMTNPADELTTLKTERNPAVETIMVEPTNVMTSGIKAAEPTSFVAESTTLAEEVKLADVEMIPVRATSSIELTTGISESTPVVETVLVMEQSTPLSPDVVPINSVAVLANPSKEPESATTQLASTTVRTNLIAESPTLSIEQSLLSKITVMTGETINSFVEMTNPTTETQSLATISTTPAPINFVTEMIPTRQTTSPIVVITNPIAVKTSFSPIHIPAVEVTMGAIEPAVSVTLKVEQIHQSERPENSFTWSSALPYHKETAAIAEPTTDHTIPSIGPTAPTPEAATPIAELTTTTIKSTYHLEPMTTSIADPASPPDSRPIILVTKPTIEEAASSAKMPSTLTPSPTEPATATTMATSIVDSTTPTTYLSTPTTAPTVPAAGPANPTNRTTILVAEPISLTPEPAVSTAELNTTLTTKPTTLDTKPPAESTISTAGLTIPTAESLIHTVDSRTSALPHSLAAGTTNSSAESISALTETQSLAIMSTTPTPITFVTGIIPTAQTLSPIVVITNPTAVQTSFSPDIISAVGMTMGAIEPAVSVNLKVEPTRQSERPATQFTWPSALPYHSETAGIAEPTTEHAVPSVEPSTPTPEAVTPVAEPITITIKPTYHLEHLSTSIADPATPPAERPIILVEKPAIEESATPAIEPSTPNLAAGSPSPTESATSAPTPSSTVDLATTATYLPTTTAAPTIPAAEPANPTNRSTILVAEPTTPTPEPAINTSELKTTLTINQTILDTESVPPTAESTIPTTGLTDQTAESTIHTVESRTSAVPHSLATESANFSQESIKTLTDTHSLAIISTTPAPITFVTKIVPTTQMTSPIVVITNPIAVQTSFSPNYIPAVEATIGALEPAVPVTLEVEQTHQSLRPETPFTWPSALPYQNETAAIAEPTTDHIVPSVESATQIPEAVTPVAEPAPTIIEPTYHLEYLSTLIADPATSPAAGPIILVTKPTIEESTTSAKETSTPTPSPTEPATSATMATSTVDSATPTAYLSTLTAAPTIPSANPANPTDRSTIPVAEPTAPTPEPAVSTAELNTILTTKPSTLNTEPVPSNAQSTIPTAGLTIPTAESTIHTVDSRTSAVPHSLAVGTTNSSADSISALTETQSLAIISTTPTPITFVTEIVPTAQTLSSIVVITNPIAVQTSFSPNHIPAVGMTMGGIEPAVSVTLKVEQTRQSERPATQFTWPSALPYHSETAGIAEPTTEHAVPSVEPSTPTPEAVTPVAEPITITIKPTYHLEHLSMSIAAPATPPATGLTILVEKPAIEEPSTSATMATSTVDSTTPSMYQPTPTGAPTIPAAEAANATDRSTILVAEPSAPTPEPAITFAEPNATLTIKPTTLNTEPVNPTAESTTPTAGSTILNAESTIHTVEPRTSAVPHSLASETTNTATHMVLFVTELVTVPKETFPSDATTFLDDAKTNTAAETTIPVVNPTPFTIKPTVLGSASMIAGFQTLSALPSTPPAVTEIMQTRKLIPTPPKVSSLAQEINHPALKPGFETSKVFDAAFVRVTNLTDNIRTATDLQIMKLTEIWLAFKLYVDSLQNEATSTSTLNARFVLSTPEEIKIWKKLFDDFVDKMRNSPEPQLKKIMAAWNALYNFLLSYKVTWTTKSATTKLTTTSPSTISIPRIPTYAPLLHTLTPGLHESAGSHGMTSENMVVASADASSTVGWQSPTAADQMKNLKKELNHSTKKQLEKYRESWAVFKFYLDSFLLGSEPQQIPAAPAGFTHSTPEEAKRNRKMFMDFVTDLHLTGRFRSDAVLKYWEELKNLLDSYHGIDTEAGKVNKMNSSPVEPFPQSNSGHPSPAPIAGGKTETSTAQWHENMKTKNTTNAKFARIAYELQRSTSLRLSQFKESWIVFKLYLDSLKSNSTNTTVSYHFLFSDEREQKYMHEIFSVFVQDLRRSPGFPLEKLMQSWHELNEYLNSYKGIDAKDAFTSAHPAGDHKSVPAHLENATTSMEDPAFQKSLAKEIEKLFNFE